jgi:hypothetical protein
MNRPRQRAIHRRPPFTAPARGGWKASPSGGAFRGPVPPPGGGAKRACLPSALLGLALALAGSALNAQEMTEDVFHLRFAAQRAHEGLERGKPYLLSCQSPEADGRAECALFAVGPEGEPEGDPLCHGRARPWLRRGAEPPDSAEEWRRAYERAFAEARVTRIRGQQIHVRPARGVAPVGSLVVEVPFACGPRGGPQE